MRISLHTPALFILALLIAACARKPAEEKPKLDPLVEERRQRDLAFKSGPESPLRDEDKARFVALEYYAPNPELRLQAVLHRHPTPQTIRIATNTTEQRHALRYGYFEFQVEGQTCRLQVYRMLDDTPPGQAMLFVPFRDQTSGRESYGGGRYIDLRENTSGIYDLDFNRSYNPSCAYGKDYSCPVPPRENTLAVPIRAGEKKFSLAEAHEKN
jgi:uncharacterized protein (DUF1684 family)